MAAAVVRVGPGSTAGSPLNSGTGSATGAAIWIADSASTTGTTSGATVRVGAGRTGGGGTGGTGIGGGGISAVMKSTTISAGFSSIAERIIEGGNTISANAARCRASAV